MLLCLDIGNTNIYGGVFQGTELLVRFRKHTHIGTSSDELGIFLVNVLRENQIDPTNIQAISLCTVVPAVLYSVRAACLKYFKIDPFNLRSGVKTGLNIKYRNPAEVGADRIANAVAAITQFPNQNLLIIDLGTATTFCAINRQKEYLGGVIIPGIKISMEALGNNAAKLFNVEIVRPPHTLGRATAESIQSGLYYGHLGMMKEISARLQQEAFSGQAMKIIGTGGFSQLFMRDELFHHLAPDLVLEGLRVAWDMNQGTS